MEMLAMNNLTWGKLIERATYYDNQEPQDEVIIKQQKAKKVKRGNAHVVDQANKRSPKKGRIKSKLEKEVGELREKLQRLSRREGVFKRDNGLFGKTCY